MKKIVLLMAMTGASILAYGQYNIPTYDTIVGRANHYYYLPYWYDDCEFYQEDTVRFKGMTLFQHEMYPTSSFDYILAEEHYTPQMLRVRGLAAMVTINLGRGTASFPPSIPCRGEEKLFLMQGEALAPSLSEYYFPRLMLGLDSVRWDTAAPKWMRLPVNAFSTPGNITDYIDCYVYEVMFDHPFKVYDTFYIIGTYRSNHIDESPLYEPGVYHNIPTAYLAVRALNHDCDHCPDGSRLFVGSQSSIQTDWSEWIFDNSGRSTTGPFLPIIFTYNLEATASPVAGGTVEGTGRFPEGWIMPLTAVPAEGYVFSQWSDGNTDNPRNVYLMSDTTLTAIFLPE